jgi:hypothetical protein
MIERKRGLERMRERVSDRWKKERANENEENQRWNGWRERSSLFLSLSREW